MCDMDLGHIRSVAEVVVVVLVLVLVVVVVLVLVLVVARLFLLCPGCAGTA
jgi:hypothetical protein